jgi:hypothetical protein
MKKPYPNWCALATLPLQMDHAQSFICSYRHKVQVNTSTEAERIDA